MTHYVVVPCYNTNSSDDVRADGGERKTVERYSRTDKNTRISGDERAQVTKLVSPLEVNLIGDHFYLAAADVRSPGDVTNYPLEQIIGFTQSKTTHSISLNRSNASGGQTKWQK